MKLIIEGFDGRLLISQTATQFLQLLTPLRPNEGAARKQRNDLSH